MLPVRRSPRTAAIVQSKRPRPCRDESVSLPRYHPVWPALAGPLTPPTAATRATIGCPSNGGPPERTSLPNIQPLNANPQGRNPSAWNSDRCWTLGISPVGSGANLGGFFPGRACSRWPHLPAGCLPLTLLRLSLCMFDCGVLYPSLRICQVASQDLACPTVTKVNPHTPYPVRRRSPDRGGRRSYAAFDRAIGITKVNQLT